jgi:hypothetical protein
MTVECLWIELWIKQSTVHAQGIIRLWVIWFIGKIEGNGLIGLRLWDLTPSSTGPTATTTSFKS